MDYFGLRGERLAYEYSGKQVLYHGWALLHFLGKVSFLKVLEAGSSLLPPFNICGGVCSAETSEIEGEDVTPVLSVGDNGECSDEVDVATDEGGYKRFAVNHLHRVDGGCRIFGKVHQED